MNMRNVGIVVVIIVIAIVGAIILLGSSGGTLVEYDNNFHITVPADFNVEFDDEWSITSITSPDDSYIVIMDELSQTNGNNIAEQYDTIKEQENDPFITANLPEISSYHLGDNTIYELVCTNSSLNSENYAGLDANVVREISIVFPNSGKVYDLIFATIGTMSELFTPEIESLINSTSIEQ